MRVVGKLCGVRIFQPFSVRSLVPVIILGLRPRPVLRFLVSVLLEEALAARSRQPYTSLVVRYGMASVYRDVPRLFYHFYLGKIVYEVFMAGRCLSFRLGVSEGILAVRMFLVGYRHPIVGLHAYLSGYIVRASRRLLHLVIVCVRLP